ncbi:hypothetical protein JHK87_026621 [Glycine soja]|nr:hypothetical protein JHK87_026621 [Glycine soja]
MESTHVISILNGEENVVPRKNDNTFQFSLPPVFSRLRENKVIHQFSLCPITSYLRQKKDTKKIIHSIKVGISLVLISLLYFVDPLYEQVGDNAIWAIMTVVVTFEFFAGATLGKGLNRGIGTVLGGGLGCIAAVLAQNVGNGGVANSIIIGCLEEYVKCATQKENKPGSSFTVCKSLLDSKSKNEMLAGKFRKMGTMAWKIWIFLSMGGVPKDWRGSLRTCCNYSCSGRLPPSLNYVQLESCEAIGSRIVWTLRELGDSMKQMRKCEALPHTSAKLKAARAELSLVISTSKIAAIENIDALAVASFVFLLKKVLDKVEELAKEVEQVGDIAGFRAHSTIASK